MYVKAATTETFTWNVDYAAIGGSDEIQNNLDAGARTNYDTWDPVPSGVWFGGWAIESQLRLTDVPDDDFQVAYASVCRFGSDVIMSGAARTLVRLPMHTPDPATWTSARLNIYEISVGTNWTFTKENETASTFGFGLGECRVNFTAGSHRLVFWSEDYDPTDVSPTDEDDHFTRSNRTYAFVDAPLSPGVAYLFVTYVRYPSDAYVETYIQPDSLDSEGTWNRSTIAVYNELAPDTYDLTVSNFNGSMGYSFDFQNGFGNSAYGLNVYMQAGDGFDFFYYVDFTQIDRNDYLSFHLPYRSTVANLSWDITLWEFDPDAGSYSAFAQWNNYLTKDFILFSMAHDWDTCSTATGLLETGWIRISLSCDNETRLWLPLWDVGPAASGARVNRSFHGSFMTQIWDSDDNNTYNLMQLIQFDRGGADYYNYHFKPQASIQFNNFQWTKSAPSSTGTNDVDPTENMSLTAKVYYAAGSFLIWTGNVLINLDNPVGQVFRDLGVKAQIVAQYLDEIMPDPIGWVRDKIYQIQDFFTGVGQWLWRAAQSVVGAIQWFVETVTYYASIILGILVLILAMIVLFLPIWVTAKLSQMLVKAAWGDVTGAVDDMGQVAGRASQFLKR
jgi:hypothetical protein